jgi:acetamidase/formamidase
MLNFIVATKGLPRDDVFMLLSAAMDLHVTEIVDGTKEHPRHAAEGDLPKVGPTRS